MPGRAPRLPAADTHSVFSKQSRRARSVPAGMHLQVREAAIALAAWHLACCNSLGKPPCSDRMALKCVYLSFRDAFCHIIWGAEHRHRSNYTSRVSHSCAVRGMRCAIQHAAWLGTPRTSLCQHILLDELAQRDMQSPSITVKSVCMCPPAPPPVCEQRIFAML